VVWLTGFDTGLVFLRRSDFEHLGGYDETRAVAEDVDLMVRLRRLGKPLGQRLRRLRCVRTVTSTRKFDRHGDWHGLHLTARTIAASLLEPLLGRRTRRAVVEQAARSYWYEDRVSPPSPPAAAPPGPRRAE